MSIRTESITRILRIRGEQPEETTVWLIASDESKSFKCITCAKTLFHRQHRVIALLEGNIQDGVVSPPISLQCPKCGHVYHVRVI